MKNSEQRLAINPWKAVLSYVIVALFLFFEMGVQVSPSVMTSSLMQDLHLGAFGLGLMSGFYFYTYTAMQIPSGMIFDRLRPRAVITLAIIVCSLGSLFFGLSTNIYLGSLARLFMGFGSAFAFVAVLVVTADLFANKYFAFITGITQMLAALGAMSGQMPLSFAVQHLGWRHTMFMLAAIGFALALLVWILLNYEKNTLKQCLSSSKKNVDHQFHHIIRNKQTWVIAIYACLLWAPMSGFASLWGVPFLQNVYGLQKSTAALVCSMMWLGLALASPIVGGLSTSFKTRRWPLALTALAGAIAFALALNLAMPSPLILGVLVFIAGAACSGQALSFTVVKEINAPQIKATAIALNNMAVVISGAIFQPVLGRLLDFHCTSQVTQCVAHHYRTSMVLILAAYIVSFILSAFFIKESYLKDSYVDKK